MSEQPAPFSLALLSLPLSDINECSQSDLNNCDQTCTDTVGSFTCGCGTGYQLASNGRTCNGETHMYVCIHVGNLVVRALV